jgi:hypothetical protein
MSDELLTVFEDVIRVVNCVKNSPLREKTAKLRGDVEAENMTLLYYCETRWLSHVRVLHRVFGLKEEIASFLNDISNNDYANICYSEDLIQELAQLVDIFEN